MGSKPTYGELEQRIVELQGVETECRQAKKALRLSEERFGSLIEHTSDAMFCYEYDSPVPTDLPLEEQVERLYDGILVECNDECAASYGARHREAVIGRSLTDLFKTSPGGLDRLFTDMIQGGYRIVDGEGVETLEDGTRRYFLNNGNGIIEDGKLVRVWGTFRDITDRKLAEEALRESEEKYHTLAENVTDIIWTTDSDFRVDYLSPSIEAILGFSPEERVGERITIMNSPEYADVVEDGLAFIMAVIEELGLEALMGLDMPYLEIDNLHKDGSVVPIEVRISALADDMDQFKGLLGVTRDISDRKKAEAERKRAEEELKASEDKFSRVFFSTPDAIAVTTQDEGIIVDINRGYEELTGYRRNEVVGKKITEVDLGISSEDSAKAQVMLHRDGYVEDLETEMHVRSGETRFVSWSIKLVELGGETHAVAVGRDITARKRMEEEREELTSQLQQAQKMEAIGTLSGGIAHDFNNILGIIIGNIELARDDVPEWSPARHNLGEIEKASLRARDMVRQILAFSRKTKHEARPTGIGSIINETLRLLRSSIPTTVEIQQDIVSRSDTVNCDPTQIHQVLMNLCTNAAHAMKETGGVLRVCLDTIRLDKDTAEMHPDLTPGEYVEIIVSDTGPGIEPEIVGKIFNPYFTTKEIGEGTGMGLSVAHGIVQNHSGSITVDSELGTGTTFSVLLPVTDTESGKEGTADSTVPRGNEHILLVDDEPAMARMYQTFLERLGYRVSARTSSIEALEAFKTQPGEYDLVITDQTMPHLTGEMLAKEAMVIRPDIPVILCTGHSDLIDGVKAEGMGISAFAMKPLTMGDIAKTIRSLLD